MLVEDLKVLPFNNISSEQYAKMDLDISANEIKVAFFSIDSNKSPGLDGFNGFFFKEY